MTRQEAMESPSVHNLTKEVLKLSEGRDVIDRYYDVLMAAEILKDEMDDSLMMESFEIKNDEGRDLI